MKASAALTSMQGTKFRLRAQEEVAAILRASSSTITTSTLVVVAIVAGLSLRLLSSAGMLAILTLDATMMKTTSF